MGDCNYEWLGKTSLRRWQIPKGGKGVHITVCISTGGRLQIVVRIFQILYGTTNIKVSIAGVEQMRS